MTVRLRMGLKPCRVACAKSKRHGTLQLSLSTERRVPKSPVQNHSQIKTLRLLALGDRHGLRQRRLEMAGGFDKRIHQLALYRVRILVIRDTEYQRLALFCRHVERAEHPVPQRQ